MSTAELAPQELFASHPEATSPSILCTSQVKMIEVQRPTLPTLPQADSYELNMSMKTRVEHQLIPGNWASGNLLAISHIPKSSAESLQAIENPERLDTRRLEAYVAELLKRSRRMGGPVDLPQRKSVSEVLSEYISALSKKKTMVLALAAAQVTCEESEAVLLDTYGAAHLKHIRDVHYVTDDPRSAAGRYFDAVSGVRFDPLEL